MTVRCSCLGDRGGGSGPRLDALELGLGFLARDGVLGVATDAAQLVERLARGDLDQPWAQRTRRIEAVQVRVGLVEHPIGHLCRQISIADEPQDRAEHGVLLFVDQLRKSRLVAIEAALHEHGYLSLHTGARTYYRAPTSPDSLSRTPRRALDGVRVLDLSRVLAGPLCCMMLGDHGADVIKVEPPHGDETRTWGPPFVDGQSAYYLNINRNKRGIVLNLATPGGQEVLQAAGDGERRTGRELSRRERTMVGWGLGYDALQQLNPRLIYASISGFGRDGPYANVAGYDAAVQALAGFMSINGEAGGQPLKAGVAVVDLATGLYAIAGHPAGVVRPR